MILAKHIEGAPDTWRFLRFLRFATLDNWSPIASSGRLSFHESTPVYPLSEALAPARVPVMVRDDETYQRVTVRMHGAGVAQRDTVPGRLIKTKRQFRVFRGQFIMSRIDARNGAFGLVPDDLDGALVTNDFPVFSVRDERASADYLRLVTSTKRFRDYCQTLSKGTTNRQRMDEDTFLSIPIPFPLLSEQQRLALAHQKAVAEAETALTFASKCEQAAAQFLETALGLKAERAKLTLSAAKLHFVPFATLERWGDVFLDTSCADEAAKYAMVRLGDVIEDLQNGWSPKCLSRPPTAGEWGVLKLGAVSFGDFDDRATKALPSDFKAKPQYEVCSGDVLISRGNALTLVGAAVYVKSTRQRLMLPDLVFRVVWKDVSLIEGAFLAEALRMPSVRRQIESVATGTSPSMKKVTKPSLFNLRFPLPPLAEQHRIVERLDALRAEARAARTNAESSMAMANQSFENSLFGPPVSA